MKKLLLASLIIALPTFVHAFPTARIGLSTPTLGGFDYVTVYQNNLTIIDSSAAVQAKYNNFTATNTFSSTTYHTSGIHVSTITFNDNTILASTATLIAGSLGSTKQVLYNNSGSVGGSGNFLIHASSVTAPGTGGLGVTYGLTMGSATINNLSTNLYVKTDGSKNLTTVVISTADIPTDVMLTDKWQAVGSSITFSTYVTVGYLTANKCVATDANGVLQSSGTCGGSGGSFINLQSTLQSGATFFVSSGTAVSFQASTMTVSSATFTAANIQSGQINGIIKINNNSSAVGTGNDMVVNSGAGNMSFGRGALLSWSSGSGENTAMGYASLDAVTTGYANTGFGFQTYCGGVGGNTNTCVGSFAGANTTVSTPVGNTMVGGNVGVYELGSQNTYIGSNNGPTGTGEALNSNMILIGAGATTTSSGTHTNSIGIGYQVAVATSNTTTIATMNLAIQSSTPSISACGATPNGSDSGTDTAGTIAVGGGVVTACTLTFTQAYTLAPTCVVSDNSTTISASISSVSTTAVTFATSASLGGGTLYYVCIGRQ